MFQNNWVAEQLIQNHQRDLQEKANQARQLQHTQQTQSVRRFRRMITKLRAEMVAL
ncbi:MAG: hypothetical protein WBC91_07320 [Phototrophicaceae bacterium]